MFGGTQPRFLLREALGPATLLPTLSPETAAQLTAACVQPVAPGRSEHKVRWSVAWTGEAEGPASRVEG